MSNTDRTANDLKEWEQTATAIAANAPDLPQAEIPRAALEKLTEELRKLGVEQKLFQRQKQETSRRIAEIHTEGNRLVTILRGLVKQHYGIRNEKLVELGVKPFRGRTRKAAPAVPPPTTEPTPVVPAVPTTPTAK
jgi:DNA-binding protein H-NS